MNILVLTSVYPQPDDGEYKTTSTVEYFCKEWASQGHRVIVIHNNSVFFKPLYYLPSSIRGFLEKILQIQFPRKESINNLEREDCGVKIFRKGMFKLIPHTSFSENCIREQGNFITKVLEKEKFKPDYIIGHWANPQIVLIDWLKKHYRGKYKTAIVFHNDCSLKDVNEYSMLEYIHSIDAVGCRNKTFGIEIKKNLNLLKMPFICYSGLPNNEVKKTKIDEIIAAKQSNSIIFVGRLVKYKRLDLIINALGKICDSFKFKLEIVGSGSEKEGIKHLIDINKITDRVTQIDSLTRDEVFEHLEQSECFTMISENETFGMVYLEAMLKGCITIATKGCVVDGIIEDGVNGFICEAGNESQLINIYKKINNMSIHEKRIMMKKAHETARNYSDYAVSKRYIRDVDSY